MKKKTIGKEYIFTALILFVVLAVTMVLDSQLPGYHIVIKVIKKASVYSLVAVSMNLLNGFTGLFSLGQAGFMLLGAYSYAVLCIPVAKRAGVYQYFDGGIVKFSLPEIFASFLGDKVGSAVGMILALLDELAQVAVLGQTALGSGNEHTHALDGNDDAALVFFGDDALENSLILNGILDVLPDLDRVEALLGKGGIALHVVDADDVGLDLVADMDDVLDLGVGIAGKLADGNVARLLAAQVDLDLGRADGRDDTGHLISCI